MAVHWYVGITGSGKTTRALEDLAADIETNKRPGLIIDSQGVQLLSKIHHADSWKKCVRRVFGEGLNCAFIPRSGEEVGAIFTVARELGAVNILFDEAAFFMSSRSIPKPIELAFRTHFHWGKGQGGIIRASTQHLADLAPVAVQCTTTIKTFRCTSIRTLDRLKAEWGYDPAAVEALTRGEFIEKGGGF